jgi:hypothetical protein
MTPAEAASLIEGIAASIRAEPAQFHFNVSISMVGTRVTHHGPGIGMQVTATGGGPGSHTVGLQSSVSMNDATFEVARQRTNAEMSQMCGKLLSTLDEIAVGLRDGSMSKKAAMQKRYEQWVPPLITSTVANILSAIAV